jgi:hypothetical protein
MATTPDYAGQVFCDRCGQPTDGTADDAAGMHKACATARRLEPPRFCPQCARRMVVQVVPTGWTARCVEHGSTSSVPV